MLRNVPWVRGMSSLVKDVEYLCGGRTCLELAFGDERWSYKQGFEASWNADRWFIHFLSWGPWQSTWSLWEGMDRRYTTIGRPIGKLSEAQARSVARGMGRLGHTFQAHVEAYLVGLNEFLASRGLGMVAFENSIRNLGWRKGRRHLRMACGVGEGSNAKVLDCWVRDRLRLRSFPVDSVVRAVVTSSAYGLPVDSDKLVELAHAVGRNPRFVARATWQFGSELVDD